MTNVVHLYPCRDIPAMLRQMADSIEAGEQGNINTMVAFTLDDDMSVAGYCWGEEVDQLRMIGALRKCENAVMSPDSE